MNNQPAICPKFWIFPLLAFLAPDHIRAEVPLFWIDHDQTTIQGSHSFDSGIELFDRKNGRRHDVKMEGDGVAPRLEHYSRYGRDVLWVEMNARSETEGKDRSEVRIVGEPMPFGQDHFVSMSIYYPSWSPRVEASNFNIFLQCPQIGAAIPHIPYNTSPPFSLQIHRDTLEVSTIHNYGLDQSGPNFDEKRTALTSIPRDRWVKIKLQFRMGRNGFVRVRVDGQLKASFSQPIGYENARNPMSGTQECSIRYGIYKSSVHTGRHGLLFDDVKFGTDQSQVYAP